ncbi:STM4504/CBY_0614 family protein [Pectinatus cerevisiiphilus]|uniref:DUF7014 domain-containing protein n=1 Tax=Pectinatus cerevisiiphilus TaxID=86956 RepID=A0A4R3K5N8_9FIRM|nr:hypothetical protein [Pectinatus cerevisiiphilus]TCS78154.1 hypothetical protein EDC37_11111 [Pectinatus cerevisiiphilus]
MCILLDKSNDECLDELTNVQNVELPKKFRTKVVDILKNTIGDNIAIWDNLAEQSCFSADKTSCSSDNCEKCTQVLLKADIKDTLLAINKSFAVVTHLPNKEDGTPTYILGQSPDEAVKNLNVLFAEHHIGYEFIAGYLLKTDAQYVFIKPAIKILDDYDFHDALIEMIRAHEYYRNGEYQKSITELLKVLDSTMKSICICKNWIVNSNTSARLINIICNNKLIPGYLQVQYTSLNNILKMDFSTMKTKAKRQINQSVGIPEYFTAYALQLTAANVIFLVKAFEDSESHPKA